MDGLCAIDVGPHKFSNGVPKGSCAPRAMLVFDVVNVVKRSHLNELNGTEKQSKGFTFVCLNYLEARRAFSRANSAPLIAALVAATTQQFHQVEGFQFSFRFSFNICLCGEEN